MTDKIEDIDLHGNTGDALYQILSLRQKPYHYREMRKDLIEMGYYRSKGREIPKSYTTIFRAMRLDERFVSVGNGYYKLKDSNFGQYSPSKLDANYKDINENELNSHECKEKNNFEIENSTELSELNMCFNNDIMVEETMNAKVIHQEKVLPEEVVTLLHRYYDDEELECAMQRAEKEYYEKFIPQFISDEMNKVMERNKV